MIVALRPWLVSSFVLLIRFGRAILSHLKLQSLVQLCTCRKSHLEPSLTPELCAALYIFIHAILFPRHGQMKLLISMLFPDRDTLMGKCKYMKQYVQASEERSFMMMAHWMRCYQKSMTLKLKLLHPTV